MKIKYITLIFLVLLIGLIISQIIIISNTSNTNIVEHELLEGFENFQIRRYPDLTVAVTDLNSNSYSNNSSSGFRKIASFIFGGNSSNEQIAMTSPVQMEMGKNRTMSFFMPPEKRINELPTPNRKDVSVKIQPSKIVAVYQFSGWASDKILEKHFNDLKNKLKSQSIKFEDTYSFLGYNPPFQLVKRKNEIIIPLINYD